MSREVSFVLPVRDGEGTLAACLAAVLREAREHDAEVIAVDDASRDGSRAILAAQAARGELRLLDGGGHGASHAMNLAIRVSERPLIAQIDQDVVLEPGWLAAIRGALDDPEVGAAQGWYATRREAPLLARVTGHDVERRWRRIAGQPTDHVATGVTLYRRSALLAAGLFDEGLGYGADVDLSYRLDALGLRLRIVPQARATHHWRHTVRGWLRQQLGFGRGRLAVLERHPGRVSGDRVAPASMMLRPPLTIAALLLLALAAIPGLRPLAPLAGAAILAALAGERLIAGALLARRVRDPAPLLFPVAHLARDLVWAWACIQWLARRIRSQRDDQRPGGAGP